MQFTLISELIMVILLLLLVVVTVTDITRHIIPNLLNLMILICGFAFQLEMIGLNGLITASGGLVVGLVIFIPFYIKGGMAAGDVKMMAAAATLLGPLSALLAAGLSLIAGMFLALLVVLYKGSLMTLLKRYLMIFKMLCFTRQLIYIQPQDGEAAALRFPYALAITTGTVLALAHQSQLGFYHLRELLTGGAL